MRDIIRGQKRGQKLEVRRQQKEFLPFFCLLTSLICIFSSQVVIAEEILKTSKVKVGEKAPLTDTLEKVHKEGKAIVLVLLPNPMQCNGCDSVVKLIEEDETRHKDIAYILKGGEDMLGAMDEETIILKRLYGFVTIGEPWTFVIDKEGVLQKIFIGRFTSKELEDMLKGAMSGE